MFRFYFLPITISIIFFSSCHNPTGIHERVGDADSAAISYYKGDGSMDSVFKFVMLRQDVGGEGKVINALAVYMESGRTPNYKCGYDGSIHFFKNNIVFQQVDFRMNDAGCMHFSFLLDGKLFNTELSQRAKDLLEGWK